MRTSLLCLFFVIAGMLVIPLSGNQAYCSVNTKGRTAAPSEPAGNDLAVTRSLISGRKVGEIAVAGRLYTEIHSKFMAARNDNNTLLNWYNLGYSGGGHHNSVGGNFGNFGLDVPWNERDLHYPVFDSIMGLPAVRFNGDNFIKGNYPAEEDIAGENDLSIELWLYYTEPRAGETILGWQSDDGTRHSAPLVWPAEAEAKEGWRHLAVVCNGDSEVWYLDGEQIRSVPREMIIEPGHRLVLGGSTENNTSFRGAILTLRVHRDQLQPWQVQHNYKGGPMLGTTLVFNFDPQARPEQGYLYDTWSDADPGNYFYEESEHFDHRVHIDRINSWSETDREEFYARIPGMFELAEVCYHNYSDFHALRMPIVSTLPQYRGDGIKYRIKIGTTDGANHMGWHDPLGFGYGMQFPGYFNPHELVHGVQVQTGGGIQGNYWEVHANFPQTYLGIYQTIPSFLELRDNNLFEASGRSYYHARLMFQHLAETPQYGPMFISKLWYDGAPDAYPWKSFKLFNPDSATGLGYEWARMVQKNVTWDYIIHRPFNPGDHFNPELYRDEVKNHQWQALSQGYVLLEELFWKPGWYRAPKGKIPQQTGWNIVPLQAAGNQVTVELDGFIDPERGSAWYGGLVALNSEGKARYSDIIRNGASLSFSLEPDEKRLYFTVVAIPDTIMAIDMVGDVRESSQDPFPYIVRFEGAKPFDKMAAYHREKFAGIPGGAHPNGGGFVDDRATVSETAYVGPGAFVIGNSEVLDYARIEDHAVVENASVSGKAIVSGHAVVESGASVKDYARVRDFGRINNNSVLSGYAKVAEHALLESGNTNSGHTTLKGIAIKYGDDASGTAMMDHHFAKGQDITRGRWFSWSWGSGKNPGEDDIDFSGLYMEMNFDREHPYMAWDDFGITWGYLVNGAEIINVRDRGSVLSLNGKDQFVELQGDVADHVEMSLLVDVLWKGDEENQPVFYFGNRANMEIYFTPRDEDGNAALVLNNNGTKEKISTSGELNREQWTGLEVYFGKDGARMYIDGDFIGENQDIVLRSLGVGAGGFTNLLGRHKRGGSYFNGMIDNLRVYNVDLKN